LGRDAETAGGVLGIDDDEIDGMRLANVADVRLHDFATGTAKYVADEQ